MICTVTAATTNQASFSHRAEWAEVRSCRCFISTIVSDHRSPHSFSWDSIRSKAFIATSIASCPAFLCDLFKLYPGHAAETEGTGIYQKRLRNCTLQRYIKNRASEWRGDCLGELLQAVSVYPKKRLNHQTTAWRKRRWYIAALASDKTKKRNLK